MTSLAERAHEDRTPFGDFVEYEQRASSISAFEMRLISGLIPTEAYMRALNAVPGRHVSQDDIERHVRMRLERQKIFDRECPLSLHVIIDEAVLCRRIGSREVMHEQLLALTSPPASVTAQVLPFSAGTHDAIGGPLIVIPLPDEPDRPAAAPCRP